MAKGSNDIILRDRLQFTVDSTGDSSLVYGRIDLSDYVSIPDNKGLAIKEVRFMIRDPTNELGQLPPFPLTSNASAIGNNTEGGIKVFATTTAFEDVRDVGIASPNVLCVYELKAYIFTDNGTTFVDTGVLEHFYGAPDLHPEGFDIVTDLLIGVAVKNFDHSATEDSNLELDVMLIAEPKKITQKDLTQMLTQAQDL